MQRGIFTAKWLNRRKALSPLMSNTRLSNLAQLMRPARPWPVRLRTDNSFAHAGRRGESTLGSAVATSRRLWFSGAARVGVHSPRPSGQCRDAFDVAGLRAAGLEQRFRVRERLFRVDCGSSPCRVSVPKSVVAIARWLMDWVRGCPKPKAVDIICVLERRDSIAQIANDM